MAIVPAGSHMDIGSAAGPGTATFVNGNFTLNASATLLLVSLVTTKTSGYNECTAVTYNGVSLTPFWNNTSGTLGQGITAIGQLSLWYLFNPPTGVSASFAATITGSFTAFGEALCFQGVNTSSQPDSTFVQTTSGASVANFSATSSVNDSNALTIAAVADSLGTLTNNGAGTNLTAYDQLSAVGIAYATSVGSQTLSVKFTSGSGKITMAIASLKPSGGGGTTVKQLSALGVG